MNKEVERSQDSESEAKIDPARLKVQRTNWKRLAGNELLKIQVESKISHVVFSYMYNKSHHVGDI